jgi:hypothetical protein
MQQVAPRRLLTVAPYTITSLLTLSPALAATWATCRYASAAASSLTTARIAVTTASLAREV